MFEFGNDYFQELNNILQDSNPSVSDILMVENFRGAFRKGIPELHHFIFYHISEFVDYAFKLPEKESSSVIQSNALFILTTQNLPFTVQLTTNRTFLLKLMSYLKDPQTSQDYTLTTLCAIFEFIISSTNGLIFIHLPEKDQFISRLVQYISNNAVYNFLQFLATSQNQVVNDYLTNSQASLVIFSSVNLTANTPESIEINNRLFQLLVNITQNLRTNSISNELVTQSASEKILSYSFKFHSTHGFHFLYYAWILFRSKNISIALPNIIKNHLSHFSTFFQHHESEFNSCQNAALLLLTQFIKIKKFLNDQVIQIANDLFNVYFENPFNSFFHLLFYNLIKVMIRLNPQIIGAIPLREKIGESFSNRNSITASYWGNLHSLSTLIIKYTNNNNSKPPKSNIIPPLEEFEEYIEKVYKPMETIMSNSYGGNIPNHLLHHTFSTSSDLSSDDDSDDDSVDIQETDNSLNDKNIKTEEEEDEVEEEEDNTDISTDTDDDFSYLNLSKFEIVKANPRMPIKSPISINYKTTLSVSKTPKSIVFGHGGLIIGIGSEKSLEIFKLTDFSHVKTRSFDTSLLAFSFTQDESQYLCCFFNKIILFNLLDSSVSQAYCIEKSNKIVMHETSTRFCIFHDDGRIQAFKLPQNIQIASFQAEPNSVITAATFSKDGNYFVVGYESGVITLFDLNLTKPHRTFVNGNFRVTSLFYDSPRQFLFAASRDKTIYKWSLENVDSKPIIFPLQDQVATIDVKDNWLISGSADKLITLIDIDENQNEYIIKTHMTGLTCVQFAPYKDMFATASKDMFVKIWTFQKSQI